MKYLDMRNWKRLEHFNYFTSFDEPFFSLVANVKCTNTFKYAKEKGISFFGLYLYKSLKVAHEIEEFRYRIIDEKVVIMDTIHASPTIARDDGTFGAAFIQYSEDFYTFIENINREKEEVQNSTGIRIHGHQKRLDTIHYTSIPWVSFTDLSHPRNYNTGDSVPKISFGKVFTKNEEYYLPLSILAHHGLMDGGHMGKYFNEYEKQLSNTSI